MQPNTVKLFIDNSEATDLNAESAPYVNDGIGYCCEYTRRIQNHSRHYVTVVEQNGLVYPVYSKEDITRAGYIVITEEWVFPQENEDELRDLLSSEVRCKETKILQQLRDGFLQDGLISGYGKVTVNLRHYITIDSVREYENLYHYNTNLLLSINDPSNAMKHPQDTLGREELAYRYDTLMQTTNAVGWRLELFSDDERLKNGLYLLHGDDKIVHVRCSTDAFRQQGLRSVWDYGDGKGPRVELIDTEDILKGDRIQLKNGLVLFPSFKEARKHMESLATKNYDHELELSKMKEQYQTKELLGKMELEEAKSKNLLLDKELEHERRMRQNQSEQHDMYLQQLTKEQKTDDRHYKWVEHKQKSEELSLKSVLAWASAVIGGVTLINKLL